MKNENDPARKNKVRKSLSDQRSAGSLTFTIFVECAANRILRRRLRREFYENWISRIFRPARKDPEKTDDERFQGKGTVRGTVRNLSGDVTQSCRLRSR